METGPVLITLFRGATVRRRRHVRAENRSVGTREDTSGHIHTTLATLASLFQVATHMCIPIPQ